VTRHISRVSVVIALTCGIPADSSPPSLLEQLDALVLAEDPTSIMRWYSSTVSGRCHAGSIATTGLTMERR
jgi:hypothetical protein